jgi:hypothetical protein
MISRLGCHLGPVPPLLAKFAVMFVQHGGSLVMEQLRHFAGAVDLGMRKLLDNKDL